MFRMSRLQSHLIEAVMGAQTRRIRDEATIKGDLLYLWGAHLVMREKATKTRSYIVEGVAN